MKPLISKSALQHSRFAFSFFLLPVYVFALSQVPEINTTNAVLVLIIWHLFIYPASNGYNSYFDKDEGSIALLENPPATDISLCVFSLGLDVAGVALSLLISLEFAAATIIYGGISKLYSHPAVRLKKHPIASFLVVFVFQGAFVYWATYAAISNTSIFMYGDTTFILGGLICSCLIGASYPLTQIYQHVEDSRRGDKTLSILLGLKGTFGFAALLLFSSAALMYVYWHKQSLIINFWLFLGFGLPVFSQFITWFLKVVNDRSQANFKNMSRMTLTSGLMMLLYFLVILFKNRL